VATSKEKKVAARELLEDLMSKQLPSYAMYNCLDELELSVEQRKNLTYDDVFWIQLLQKSLHGDMKATQEILDRRYGKAPQHILQEVHSYSYADFLDKIEVDETVIDIPPQITESQSPADGGSSGDELLDDLGLLDG
jgi:hypothetical protein